VIGVNRVIVVGYGGATGGAAMAWAAEEAAASAARLIICVVCRPTSLLARHAAEPTPAWLELANPALARAVAATRTRLGGHRVTVSVRTGRPGPSLVETARHADLLVIGAGTHPHLGSGTVGHVARHAACPVLVTGPPATDSGGPFAGHVVVGVDGSAAGRAALAFGFAYADLHQLPLAATHITALRREDYWYDDVTLSTHFATEPADLELLADQLEPWTHSYPHVPVKRAVLAGSVVGGLLRAGAGARLLVVGLVEHGRITRAVTGDHAQMVLDAATGPVVLVPATELAGVLR
jgi:nucleotide-binding universal stress UspA family protein